MKKSDIRHYRRQHNLRLTLMGILTLLALAAATAFLFRPQKPAHLRIGVTPYQDTAIVVVPDEFGWYKDEGIEVEFVSLDWGDVMPALSSGAIDASIYTISSFQPAYQELSRGGIRPVFYCPIYVFKGTAIMVHTTSDIQPFPLERATRSAQSRSQQLKEVVRQLKGKRIAVTRGTEYEHIVLSALQIAGLDPNKDVTLIHATPQDALAAFISKDVDAFGAGLTERIEARRRGGVELLTAADLGQPSIDGIVTTEAVVAKKGQLLDKAVSIWFRTVSYMEQDLPERSKYVRKYLEGKASTKYTSDEYVIAWTFNVFPKTAKEAEDLFGHEGSPYWWRNRWQNSNEFLLQEKKITVAVPESAYMGTTVLKRLAASQ